MEFNITYFNRLPVQSKLDKGRHVTKCIYYIMYAVQRYLIGLVGPPSSRGSPGPV